MTADERKLWHCLRRNNLGGIHFRRQQIISGYIVDFYCDAARLAIEVDGPIHKSSAMDDRYRDRAIARIGVKVIRFESDAVEQDLDRVLKAIVNEVKKGQRDLTPGPFPLGKGNQT